MDLWVTDSYIYWANESVDAEGVWRCALDGSAAVHLIDTGSGVDPWGLCVTSSYIYLAINESDTIERCDLDGTNLTTLVSGLRNPIGVGVTDSNIYWTSATDLALKQSTLAGASITTIGSVRENPKYVRVVASEPSGQVQ